MWRCRGTRSDPMDMYSTVTPWPQGRNTTSWCRKRLRSPRQMEGELPATRAGEFGAVLLACGVAVPTGVVRVVWEMALDRVPPATLTFSKPKAWLVQRMRVHKGKCYKLAREGTA